MNDPQTIFVSIKIDDIELARVQILSDVDVLEDL